MAFIKPLKIGNFKCKNNLMLAPMAGVTGLPFRQMCIKGGAGLVFGEMVSACALKYKNKKSRKLLFTEKNTPTALQIFGADTQSISIAAKEAQKAGAGIVDINAGCPVKKIVKSGAGINLMKDEKLFGSVIKTAVKAVKIPVTVKIRLGLKKGENIAPALARIAQCEGAAAIIVHGRYANAVHSGSPDLDGLNKVCASVKIPVIANGGIRDFKTAKEMFDTGCAAVMIGRAAIGCPDIFNRLQKSFKGGRFKLPSAEERIKTFMELLEKNAAYYGERAAILRCRKIIGWWIRDFAGAAKIRTRFMQTETLKNTVSYLNEASGSIC
jgi:nifR3 family TIM-barrel protein